jgi:hypothetical protein
MRPFSWVHILTLIAWLVYWSSQRSHSAVEAHVWAWEYQIGFMSPFGLRKSTVWSSAPHMVNISCHARVELSLSYGRRSVDQFILVSGSPLGPMTTFYLYLFFSDKCFVLPVGRPLWREDGSVEFPIQCLYIYIYIYIYLSAFVHKVPRLI